ncbi:MAG: UvrD-helicase domain-containing protein [Lachnospiraceae bacterium]|nr:UvrD-helicase domain-containing protein [Lachnospiraceae bacterium]
MRDTVKVAISSDFLTAFAALPRKIQGRVTEFLNKFRNDPVSPGIHYEKIRNAIDDKIWSVRIDDTYRGIVARQEKSGVYLLLWVDHHDEAYDWAQRKRCEVNPKSGVIQVFDVQEVVENILVEGEKRLFANVSDSDLFDLGLPETQLEFARSIRDTDDFYAKGDMFPKDAYENLSWIAEGFLVEEVRELLETDKMDIPATDDIAEALGHPESMKSFVVVEGEDELRRIMAEPLEKWRVFLHPTQRRIVQKSYSGATRVLGTAGTGKTVVAMHRAKQLAASCKEQEKVLFTTFTSNLAGDIRQNLRKICSVSEMRRIEVINLDAWVSAFFREHGYGAEILYEDKTIKLWEDAIASVGEELGFSADFYEDEWKRVIVANEAFSLPLYVKAPRTGRGTRLDRKKRMQIWKVVESYQRLMKERNVRDINMAMYECRTVLAKMPKELLYKHVIVDEGQDFSANAFRLLRALAGEAHPDDLFIVGDSHQRIYKNKAVLSKCGINIRGRSSVLRINYRTTEEIRKAAFTILKGVSFDDLDEGVELGGQCQSLMHGLAPVFRNFKDAAAEFEYILDEVKKLSASGVSLKDICIVARTHKLLEDYIVNFTGNGLRSFEMKRSKPDDRGLEGLRMATMHRVKGLEFKYVFIVAVNQRVVPLMSAIDHTDHVVEQETITAEKCLLYVAMTRAQKAVTITSYGRKSEFL